MVSHGCIYDQVILRVVCIEFGVEWDVQGRRRRRALARVACTYSRHCASVPQTRKLSIGTGKEVMDVTKAMA